MNPSIAQKMLNDELVKVNNFAKRMREYPSVTSCILFINEYGVYTGIFQALRLEKIQIPDLNHINNELEFAIYYLMNLSKK